MKEILKYLAQRNGTEQDIFVLEEMSELQKELMKHRLGKDNRDKIVDESVDVLLTIFILLQVYDATEDEVKEIIDTKLNELRVFIPAQKSSTFDVKMKNGKIPKFNLGDEFYINKSIPALNNPLSMVTFCGFYRVTKIDNEPDDDVCYHLTQSRGGHTICALESILEESKKI